jgi:hypothetical protein
MSLPPLDNRTLRSDAKIADHPSVIGSEMRSISGAQNLFRMFSLRRQNMASVAS